MLTTHKQHAPRNWSPDIARDRVAIVSATLATVGALIGLLSIVFLR